MKLIPYLVFPGNTLEALEFYADIFGGTVENVMKFGDMPPEEHFPGMNPDHVANASVALPGGGVLMANDTDAHKGFEGISIMTDWDNPEDATAAFNKLADGGSVVMPCGPTFWAKAFGVCVDKYGVGWMVNSE